MPPRHDLARRAGAIAITAAACLALLVAGASSARAARGKYAERGVYVILAGSAAFPLFRSSSNVIPGLIDGDDYGNTVGFNAAAGLRVARHVGLDLGIEYIPSFEASSIQPASIDTALITINGRFYLPGLGLGLSDRIQPYALAGAGVLIADSDVTRLESDFAARLGGGLDYWLTNNLALGVNATYVLTTGDVDGLDYVSLGWGLQYTFH